MAIEKSAGAVVYRILDDETVMFLLLQPALGKPWGFPKGKLDEGESEEDAARREIAEETGLSDSDIELDFGFRLVIHYHYRRGRKIIKKDVTYFLARALTDEVHLSWEHVAYRWAPRHTALDLVIYENARETLGRAYSYLSRKHNLPSEG